MLPPLLLLERLSAFQRAALAAGRPALPAAPVEACRPLPLRGSVALTGQPCPTASLSLDTSSGLLPVCDSPRHLSCSFSSGTLSFATPSTVS